MSGGAPTFTSASSSSCRDQAWLPPPSAHRQVGDQTDGHPGLARLALGMLQATLGQPLAEGTEVHFLGVIGAERGRPPARRGGAAAPAASPVGAGAQVRLQGLEAAVVQQGLAGFAAEFGEVVAQGTGALGEVAVELAQQRMRRSAPLSSRSAPGSPGGPSPRPGRRDAARGGGKTADARMDPPPSWPAWSSSLREGSGPTNSSWTAIADEPHRRRPRAPADPQRP